ncbi:MAG: aspartyl protease family protein [Anditalea sp.]
MDPKVRRILFVFFIMLGFSVDAQVPGFFMKEDARKIVIPFVEAHNLIIIPVSINDGPPINFLFDTGVKSNILFSKAIGDELGLTYTRKLNLVGADGQTVLTALVSVNNRIDLEEIEGSMQAMLVLEEDFLELENVIGVPVYGVIGYEFFKYNPIKIDYDTNTITFYRTSALKWRPFGYRKMDIQLEDNKPYIFAQIKQIQGPDLEAKLLIDTGANHSLLLNREASEEIVLPPLALESELGRSLGGDLFGFIGRIRRLKLGGLNFRKVLSSYPDETEFSHIILGTGRIGSLGSELLSRMKIILDYPRERILFKKGTSFSEPFEYDMSGITVRLLSGYENRVYVSQVRKDSPAFKRGVQKFDEIVSINEIPIDFWKLSDINDLLRSEEGRVINLRIVRSSMNEAEELTVSFVLKKQL